MNNYPPEGHENEDKGRVGKADDKAPGDKSTEKEEKTGKHGEKSGTVLGEINDDPKKASK